MSEAKARECCRHSPAWCLPLSPRTVLRPHYTQAEERPVWRKQHQQWWQLPPQLTAPMLQCPSQHFQCWGDRRQPLGFPHPIPNVRNVQQLAPALLIRASAVPLKSPAVTPWPASAFSPHLQLTNSSCHCLKYISTNHMISLVIRCGDFLMTIQWYLKLMSSTGCDPRRPL